MTVAPERQKRTYVKRTPQQKARALQLAAEVGQAEASRRLGISQSLISYWARLPTASATPPRALPALPPEPPAPTPRGLGEDPERIEAPGVQTSWRCPGCSRMVMVGIGESPETAALRHAYEIIRHLHAVASPLGVVR